MYPSSLTAEQFDKISHFFETKYGRPKVISNFEIINAILYVQKTGCQWRQLPKDFPKWQTVYANFRRWNNLGLFEYINKSLVEKTEDVAIDSRSVRASAELQKKTKALMDIKWSKASKSMD